MKDVKEKVLLLLDEFLDWFLNTMRAKLLAVLLLVPVLLAVFYAIFRASAPISPLEIRLFGLLFLLSTIVGNFAFLRLYNALVSNSSFLLGLRKELLRFSNQLDKFTTSFGGNVRVLKDALKKHRESVDANGKDLQRVTRVLKREE